MNIFQPLIRTLLDKFPELDESDLIFAPAPNPEVGDVALRSFLAAKKLKLPPPAAASLIADKVAFGPEVMAVSCAGPYVNFKLDREVFGRQIVADVFNAGPRYGSNQSGNGQRALVEHTSINPNASPHVGRARNAMIGDSLVRLLRFEGYDVEVHYYVNDIGRQIAMLVLVCDHTKDMTFDEMLETYRVANERAENEPEFAEAAYALLAKIEQGDPETQQHFHAVTEMCLRGQLAVLGRLGITYDVFERESKFVKDPRLDQLLDTLRERGAVFTDEEERLTVDLSKLGYEPEEGRYVPLIRSNGSSLYLYRDLAYSLEKQTRGAHVNLIVLGEDHKLYAKQVALILETAGYAAPEPIYYSYILLREGKMSTRRGQVVLLSAFLDEATQRARERVDEQCHDLTEEERQLIAAKVAVAAVRFAILRVNPNKNVIFDWDASLSFAGDTGPYVQYSCARIASILRKFGDVPEHVSEAFPVETDAEWLLLTQLAAFSETVATAVNQRSCAPIGQYALETARLFTSFYHDCPVLDAPLPEQRIARAQICAATRQTLENALALLGIEALDRM